MDTNENCMDYIHLTDEHLLGSHNWKGRLDLLNVFMIGLGKEISKAGDEDFKLHRLFGTVFSDKIPLDEKLKVMEDEFNIPMGEDLKEDLNDMCNLSQGIVERTTRNVTDKINELNERLSEDNRMDELVRSFKDKKLQDKLLVEYGLNDR
jgi:hypothetical protein